MNVEAELRRLLDRAEIGDLMLAFGAALDRKDWDAYADTFTPEGTFTIMGQVRRGREEIGAGPARDHAGFDVLQHFSTNHAIAIDGDRARASHYLIAVHVPDASAPALHADTGGRYDCECVRTPDGWRFAAVTLTFNWAAGETFEIEPEN